MPCGCLTIRTTAVTIWHQVAHRACTEVSAALEVSSRPVQRSHQLQNLTILIVNLVASWMHLHNYRCFQVHLRMLLQSLRALCKAPGGPGSIWKYFEELVRVTRVSRRFACGFQTNLHFADVLNWLQYLMWIQQIQTAESEVLSTILRNCPLTLLQNREPTKYHQNRVSFWPVYRIDWFLLLSYQSQQTLCELLYLQLVPLTKVPTSVQVW